MDNQLRSHIIPAPDRVFSGTSTHAPSPSTQPAVRQHGVQQRRDEPTLTLSGEYVLKRQPAA
jgi:hypothetical protein